MQYNTMKYLKYRIQKTIIKFKILKLKIKNER